MKYRAHCFAERTNNTCYAAVLSVARQRGGTKPADAFNFLLAPPTTPPRMQSSNEVRCQHLRLTRRMAEMVETHYATIEHRRTISWKN